MSSFHGGSDGQHRQSPAPSHGDPAEQSGAGDGRADALRCARESIIYAIQATPAAARHDLIPRGDIKVGEIRAYRVWRVFDFTLTSMWLNEVWWQPDQPMTGDVTYGGVHAWKDMNGALDYVHSFGRISKVVGAVDLWGEVVEHEHGYRASFAKIVSLDRIIHGSQNKLDILRDKYLRPGIEATKETPAVSGPNPTRNSP